MSPRTIDVSGAAQRFRTMSVDGFAPGRNRPGWCLRWTYFAVMPGVQELTPLNNAVDVWNYCPPEHRHPIPADGRVPAGGVIVLGPSPTRHDANAPKGDVYVSDGGAGASGPATDGPGGAGRIGTVTGAYRSRQTQRPILGWVSMMGGYPLSVAPASPLPTRPATPNRPQEDPMALPISFVKDARSKTVFAVGAKGRVGVKSPYHLTLLKRAQVNQGGDPMLVAELDIIQSYTRAIA